MNFGLSVLHIVVEPATGCFQYVGVDDTIEQLLMVHIVKCSCQIERDEHCSAMSAVIVDSAVLVQCLSRGPC